jgi:hypothetical protein
MKSMDKILARDGFRILQSRVELPFEYPELDHELQIDLLICHLFINDARSLQAIAQIGLDRQRIVGALLKQGVIEDRRHSRVNTIPDKNCSSGAESTNVA